MAPPGMSGTRTLKPRYNNPLPMLVDDGSSSSPCVFAGLIYLVLYPGLGNATPAPWAGRSRSAYDDEQAKSKAEKEYGPYASRNMLSIAGRDGGGRSEGAMPMGERLFLNYCSSLPWVGRHAAAKGFPNLDRCNDWLWGGTL